MSFHAEHLVEMVSGHEFHRTSRSPKGKPIERHSHIADQVDSLPEGNTVNTILVGSKEFRIVLANQATLVDQPLH